jgi:hypothetical protein
MKQEIHVKSIMMRLAATTLLSVMVLLTGCGPTPWQTYDGPIRKVSEIATLSGGNNVTDVAIDGKKLSQNNKSDWDGTFTMHLLPGRHVLTAKCYLGVDSINMDGMVCIRRLTSEDVTAVEFEAVAGGRYTIAAGDNTRGIVQVQDSKGVVVMAGKPTPLIMTLQRVGFAGRGY